MKIELHILQNFAPSNLNRDDTGAPKDCEFGGHRRARISSQCQKRAVRNGFIASSLVGPENQGARTKRLAEQVVEHLDSAVNGDAMKALRVIVAAIQGQGLGVPLPDSGSATATDAASPKRRSRSKAAQDSENEEEDDERSGDSKSQYLLFVPRWLPRQFASVLSRNWPEVSAAAMDWNFVVGNAKKKKEKIGKYKKLAPTAWGLVEQLLKRANSCVDVALFGRMIADKPEWNVDAACQVAQAISTNKVQMDFDFFTAVDDFKPNDNAGSDMMGTVQFNSSCFYRYAVLDVDSLRASLDADDALLKKAVGAFVQGFVSAIPTGKQNGMAAHNFPSYALAVVRAKGQPLSLANAFLKPARPHGDDDLVDDSVRKLESYARRLDDVLGEATKLTWADRDLPSDSDAPMRTEKIGAFYTKVTDLATGAS